VSERKALGERAKQLAADLADAQAALELAKRPMWVQVRSHQVERIEAELHAVIDELAGA